MRLLVAASKLEFEKAKTLCVGQISTTTEEEKEQAKGVEGIFTSLGTTTGYDYIEKLFWESFI
jgi:hypothetical protein